MVRLGPAPAPAPTATDDDDSPDTFDSDKVRLDPDWYRYRTAVHTIEKKVFLICGIL